jgi:S-methylmethionine-dependent homocysteine/selenocysteine methylase
MSAVAVITNMGEFGMFLLLQEGTYITHTEMLGAAGLFLTLLVTVVVAANQSARKNRDDIVKTVKDVGTSVGKVEAQLAAHTAVEEAHQQSIKEFIIPKLQEHDRRIGVVERRGLLEEFWMEFRKGEAD